MQNRYAMPDKTPLFEPFTGETCYHWYNSPIGNLLITGNQSAIASITFPIKKITAADEWPNERPDEWIEKPAQFKEVCRQLDLYFAGKLKAFDLPLTPAGTDFQQSVWSQLLKIPYGQTTSYGKIADRIGNKKASRAVGSANGRNPIPVIIPCHRVIGSDGSLTGFGGGLPTKSYLLNLENSDQLCLPL